MNIIQKSYNQFVTEKTMRNIAETYWAPVFAASFMYIDL